MKEPSGKVDSMYKELGIFSRDGNHRESQTEILDIKIVISQMRNSFEKFVSKLNSADKSSNSFECRLSEITMPETKVKESEKK
jgi:hypothetical protein